MTDFKKIAEEILDRALVVDHRDDRVNEVATALKAQYIKGLEDARKAVKDADPLLAPDPSEWEDSESIADSVKRYLSKAINAKIEGGER